jgi:hypothetical protein
MANNRQRIFITPAKVLANGLHDGTIIKATLTRPFYRVSLSFKPSTGDAVRIDFEIAADDRAVNQANNAQFTRLKQIAGLQKIKHTDELSGVRIGVRIEQGRFCQFESPYVGGAE